MATLFFASALLFLALRGIDWAQMLAVLQQGRLNCLLWACLVLSVSYFMGGQLGALDLVSSKTRRSE